MGFIKGTDGIARTVRNPLEGAVGDVALENITAVNLDSGTISASGNVTGGNVLTTGLILATGNISGGNLSVTSIVGTLTTAAQTNITSLGTLTALAVTGNITAGNVSGTRGAFTNVAGALETAAQPNITSVGTLTSLNSGVISSSGNVTGDNVITGGLISATGNCTAGNISVTGTGNVTGNLVGRVFTALQPAITTLGTLTNMNTNGNANVAQAVNSTTVVATGNVSGGNISTAGNITGNTAGFAIGYRDIPQISFTANTSLAATDAGKHYYSTLATDNTLTIANNTSVTWAVGTAITVINHGSGNINIAQATGVSLYLAGNSTADNRTMTTYGMATLMNVAGNTWVINGTGLI